MIVKYVKILLLICSIIWVDALVYRWHILFFSSNDLQNAPIMENLNLFQSASPFLFLKLHLLNILYVYVFVYTNVLQLTCKATGQLEGLYFYFHNVNKHRLLDLIAFIFTGQPSHWTLYHPYIPIHFLYFAQFAILPLWNFFSYF